MAPCKRQVKATRHLICNSCSNWVDFVKSGCEKSWAEVQADSFSFECRGCTRMKELEVELEQLRLLVVAVVEREQVVCVSGSGGGTIDDKVGEDDERDARESSLQSGRRLRGGKVTGHRETGRKETGRRETGRKETRRKEMGGKTNRSKERGMGETVANGSEGKDTIAKAMGVRETGGGVSGGKVTGAQVNQATGGKGDRLMSEREPDNSLPPSDKTAGQNVMEGIHRKSYSEAVIEGVRKRARVFVGDSIVSKTDRVLNKGDDVVVCLPGAKIEAITERVENNLGGRARVDLF